MKDQMDPSKLYALGFYSNEIVALQKISKRLSSFYERCCDEVSYNDEKGYYERYNVMTGEVVGKYPDYEKGCERRLKELLKESNWREDKEIAYYLQTDCRGCALYVYDSKDFDKDISSCYSSIGIAIY